MNACKPVIISMMLEQCCQQASKEALIDYFFSIRGTKRELQNIYQDIIVPMFVM